MSKESPPELSPGARRILFRLSTGDTAAQWRRQPALWCPGPLKKGAKFEHPFEEFEELLLARFAQVVKYSYHKQRLIVLTELGRWNAPLYNAGAR